MKAKLQHFLFRLTSSLIHKLVHDLREQFKVRSFVEPTSALAVCSRLCCNCRILQRAAASTYSWYFSTNTGNLQFGSCRYVASIFPYALLTTALLRKRCLPLQEINFEVDDDTSSQSLSASRYSAMPKHRKIARPSLPEGVAPHESGIVDELLEVLARPHEPFKAWGANEVLGEFALSQK